MFVLGEVYDLLAASDALTALVPAGNIYQVRAAQNTCYPCIVLSLISSVEQVEAMSNDGDLYLSRVQVDIYAKKVSDCENIHNEVRAVLKRVVTENIKYSSEKNGGQLLYLPDSDETYRATMDYEIKHIGSV